MSRVQAPSVTPFFPSQKISKNLSIRNNVEPAHTGVDTLFSFLGTAGDTGGPWLATFGYHLATTFPHPYKALLFSIFLHFPCRNKPILSSIKTPIHCDGSFVDSSRSLASFFSTLGAGATCFILLTTHSQRVESRWSARQVPHYLSNKKLARELIFLVGRGCF